MSKIKNLLLHKNNVELFLSLKIIGAGFDYNLSKVCLLKKLNYNYCHKILKSFEEGKFVIVRETSKELVIELTERGELLFKELKLLEELIK